MGKYLLAGLIMCGLLGWFIAGPGFIRSRVGQLVEENNHCAISMECEAYETDYEFFPCQLSISKKEGVKVREAVELFKKIYPASGKKEGPGACAPSFAVCREGRCVAWK